MASAYNQSLAEKPILVESQTLAVSGFSAPKTSFIAM